jgi:4-hydroxy-4-methyl-2-oxoglutarate aldolase
VVPSTGHRESAGTRWKQAEAACSAAPAEEIGNAGSDYGRRGLGGDLPPPETRLAMLDSITPGTVSVWACGGSVDCAHWGEIMSTAARQRGCTGAVIDGGVRDVDFINAMGYPVFARFKCSATSIGRWDIREHQVPIKIGNTVIHPADFVFGDIDGVVIVPKEICVDILVAAEDLYRRESAMREELRSGMPMKDAHAKYGSL